MPPFRNEPIEWERTDWRLLQNGFVHLFWSDEVLIRTIDWLSGDGYRIVALESIGWSTPDDALREIGRALSFPEYFGGNLNAFDDCLGDVAAFAYGADAESTGTVLVLKQFDRYTKKQPDLAHGVLDAFARSAQHAALIGHRMLCLVQSDNPDLTFPGIGCRPVPWNPAEFQTAKRHP